MHTLKKFIKYYGPYKVVFFYRLIMCNNHQSCGSGISTDIAFADENAVRRRGEADSVCVRTDCSVAFCGICSTDTLQVLRDICGTYDGCTHGARYAQGTVRPLRKAFVFLLRSAQFRTDDEQAGIGSVRYFRIGTSWPGESFYFSDQDCGIVPVFVCDQLETGDSDAGARSCYADFFLWAEPQNAGDVHGQPQKNRRYQFQSAGYIVRYSCGAVVCK